MVLMLLCLCPFLAEDVPGFSVDFAVVRRFCCDFPPGTFGRLVADAGAVCGQATVPFSDDCLPMRSCC